MKPLTIENLNNCDYSIIAIFDNNNLLEVIHKNLKHNCFDTIGSDCSTSAPHLVSSYQEIYDRPLFITNAELINKCAQETDKENLLKRKYLIHWVETENITDDEFEFIESNIKSDIFSFTFDELDKFIRSDKTEIRIDYLGDCDTVRTVDINKTTDQNNSGVKIVGDYEF